MKNLNIARKRVSSEDSCLQFTPLSTFADFDLVCKLYSSLPNKRTGWNFDQNTIVQGKNWQFYI